MSEDALELGCKISLISKAGIRYEGRLFTVDPDQCTIALSGVRSFGTEDRDVPQKVPPQNNVYDYILFRGTDIRDIVVLNTAPTYPNDPAIMQLTLQPKPYATQAFGQSMIGPPPHLGQFPPSGYGAAGMLMGGLAGAPGMSGMGRAAAEQAQQAANRGFPKPSELTMPGEIPVVPADHHNQHLSPAAAATVAVAAAAAVAVVDTPTTDGHDMFTGRSRSTTPASLISGKSSTADQGIQVSGAYKRDDKKMVQPIQPPGQRGPHQQHQHQQREMRDSRGEHNQNQQRNQQNRNRYPNNQQQNNQRQQGGWIQRGPQRPRGRGRNTGYKNPNIPQTDAAGKPKIKFDQEYDFEQANSEFENLKNQLAKVKLEDAPKPEVNGDTDKKDDSGNETGAGEGEPEEETEVYYDKAKSFFDNISCEAVERSKGRSQRTDWRTERKLNSETFGVAATRRGNYRGRGPYRPMGGGYRGTNNYRRGYQNQRNNQPNQQQSQNNAQSSTSGVNKPLTMSQSQPVAVNSTAKK